MTFEKYSIDYIFDKYQISGYDMLINIIESYKSHKCNIIIEDTPEYKENQMEIKSKEKKIALDVNKLKKDIKDEYQNYINIEETKEYKKLLKEFNALKDEKDSTKDNNEISRLTEEISKLSKIIEENQINHKNEVEKLKTHYDGIISDLNKKNKVPLPTPSNTSKKQENTQSCVPDFDNSKTYKIIILDNPNTKVKQKIGRRTYEFLNFYKELMDLDKIESNSNFNSLNDCTEYILKSKGLPLSKQNKSNWKRNIIRCNEIFNLFKDKLINVYYNINNIRYIKNEYWEQWKTYVGNKIDEFYNVTQRSVPNKNETS